MKELIEFTDREQFVVSYYRDPQLSSWSLHAASDGTYLAVSVLLLVLSLIKKDLAWGLLGYGILVYRLAWGFWRSRLFSDDLRSVIKKYDAKIQELGGQQAKTGDA